MTLKICFYVPKTAKYLLKTNKWHTTILKCSKNSEIWSYNQIMTLKICFYALKTAKYGLKNPTVALNYAFMFQKQRNIFLKPINSIQ